MGDNNLRVGAGKAIIELPQEIFPIENFNGVHDDIHVRVLLIESNIDIVIVSFELTSLRDYEIVKLKNIISNITNIEKENIWICVTHTFSTPHIRSIEALKTSNKEVIKKNNMLSEILENALSEALEQAIQRKEEAEIGFGNGYCSVNVNRDVYTSKGWWIGANDLGISDKSVPVIRFNNSDNDPIAIIYSCDVQSSIMDGSLLEDGTKLVTSDLTGIASKYIESQYDEKFVAMYIVGAAGDQSPIFKAKHNVVDRLGNINEEDVKKDGFVLINALGKKLGNQVMVASEKINTSILNDKIVLKKSLFQCPGQVIPKSMKDIRPTHKYEYVKDEDRKVSLEIINIGNCALVGIQPELSSVSAMEIRKQSPFNLTMIFTIVNGGAKYMADQASYDRITYESMNSIFYRGSAEILVKETIKSLEEIKFKE